MKKREKYLPLCMLGISIFIALVGFGGCAVSTSNGGFALSIGTNQPDHSTDHSQTGISGVRHGAADQADTKNGMNEKDVRRKDYVASGTWSTIETVRGDVSSLAVAPDGTLYVGGGFQNIGGTNVNQIAKWNGSTWIDCGTGLKKNDGGLLALTPDGTLYTAVGNCVFKWNGSAWTPIGSKLKLAHIGALAVSPDGTLYAGGQSDQNAMHGRGLLETVVHKWNGSKWSALKPGGLTEVHSIAVAPDGTTLYVSDASECISKWNGSQWSTLPATKSGGASFPDRFGCLPLVVAPDGILYAGGNFLNVAKTGKQLLWDSDVFRWDGSKLTLTGLSSTKIGGMATPLLSITALAISQDGILYAAVFAQPLENTKGNSNNFVARWNGSKWSIMGELEGVKLMTVAPDGTLYAAGGVADPSDSRVTKGFIAKWNSSK